MIIDQQMVEGERSMTAYRFLARVGPTKDVGVSLLGSGMEDTGET